MAKTRAVTHADLAPSPSSADLGSKAAAFLMILTILCGFFCFILCIIAEATRSQVTWVENNSGRNGENSGCVYSGSGKSPLLCAAIAFVGLAVAMVVEHLYMLFAVSKALPPGVVSWDPDSALARSITWQAGVFFVSTWVCFAVGEILLLIGLSVESGHLKNWSRPKQSCIAIKEGLFSAAGAFSLVTVFLAAGLYLTALRAQRMSKEQETARREMLEASTMFASPPRSPSPPAIARENPVARENHIEHPSFSFSFPFPFSKHQF
ncbi:hypothetical protein K2173_009121 [Erythroxylum novogranatense]|uniref:Transmembrane protein n=1 Tax=Erythroxylum novogranatense TaxID=1862640 RepID=A0AAV8TIW7_9ROSI|nr:hypothetical protein K2173_009121 [Erythroxylum novogranatense]